MDIEEWLIQLSEGYDGVVMAVVSSHEERDYECPIPLTGRDAIHLWLTVWGTLKDSVAVAVCDWWNPQGYAEGAGDTQPEPRPQMRAYKALSSCVSRFRQ